MATATLSPSPAPDLWRHPNAWTVHGKSAPHELDFPPHPATLDRRTKSPAYATSFSIKSRPASVVSEHVSAPSVADHPDSAISVSSNPRRKLKANDGYQCTAPGCDRTFSLMCELRKHFKTKHTPDSARAHGCPYCDKRFNWPKDVKRHLRQVHKDITTRVDYLPAPASTSRRPGKRLSLRAAVTFVMAVQAFCRRPDDASDGMKDEDASYILVTKDSNIFHRVETYRIENSHDGLVNRILRQCGSKHDRPSSVVLRKYRPNAKLSKPLRGADLLFAVEQAAATRTTLELSLTTTEEARQRQNGALQRTADRASSSRPQVQNDLQRLCDKVDFILGTLSRRVDVLLANTRLPSRRPRSSISESGSDDSGDHDASLVMRSQSMAPRDESWAATRSAERQYACRRARTLPALPRTGRSEGTSSPRIRQCAGSQQNQNSTVAPNSSSTGNGSSASNSAGKRPVGSNKDAREEDSAGRKRRQRNDGEDSSSQEGPSLPCMFHVGEPCRFRSHTKMYKHMAELQRHLRSSRHLFFACHDCFKEFDNGDALTQHKCVKACSAPGCRRYRLVDDPTPERCACIRNSRQQWLAVFRLRYPFAPAPAGFENIETEIEADGPDLLAEFNFDDFFAQPINSGAPHESMQSLADVIPSIEQPAHSNQQPIPLAQPNEPSTTANDESTLVSRLLKSLKTIEDLRKNLQLLEQRLAQPSAVQRQLESVLGMVWKELKETGSQSSKPNSPLWNMVFAFAPGVISSAAQEDAQMQPQANVMDWDMNVTMEGFGRPVPASDSGYASRVGQRVC